MTKFVLLAAFAVGASLGLTAGIDTLKSARMRAKARLREALAVDDKVSNPDATTGVKITTVASQSIDHRRDVRSRRRLTAIRPRAADRLATRAKLAECNEKAPGDSAIKIYERDAPTTAPDNIVVFSANADGGATRCVDVFLRNDGSYGFDEYRRDDGQGWTATLPDFYSREKYATAAEARAEARAAIPWFEAWQEDTTESLKDEEEALVNVAAVMGFSYAYEGFPTC